ncbi:MAG: serpin family protein [Bacillota bacterium]
MKRHMAVFLCVCFCTLLVLGGCTASQAQGLQIVYAGGLESAQDIQDNPAFSQDIRAFSVDLFKELAMGQKKNVLISPASIALALGMTYNGARSTTAAQMRNVLHLQGMDAQTVNDGFLGMAHRLDQESEKVTVQLSNALWANKDVKIGDTFIQTNKKYFGAMLANMDFADPNTVKTINDWVKESTNGKIDKILDQPIDPQTILFIMNAIYFDGSWTKPFKAENTKQETFHGLNGDKQVSMMHQREIFEHAKIDGGQMAFLPYGSGDLGMYIVLPDEDSSIAGTVAKLDANTWKQWTESLGSAEGDIGLPQFKLEYETHLKDVLSKMGMADAFLDTEADFSGIAENVSIKDVRHKAFIDVDEKGTRAAAVTSVEMRETAALDPKDTFAMLMDRPFLFAIADKKSGTILFMGTVVDP